MVRSMKPTSEAAESHQSRKNGVFSSLDARNRFVAATQLDEQPIQKSVIESLKRAESLFADRPALSFQLDGTPDCPSTTLTWAQVVDTAFRFAALLEDLGVSADDKVAYLLPNLPETVATFLGAMIQGVVVPVNPLFESEQISDILNETQARVLVTLKPLPRVDIAQRAAAAVSRVSSIVAVVEVDLADYLPIAKRLAVKVLRPRVRYSAALKRLSFSEALPERPTAPQGYKDGEDRVVACFHTGGTTGSPKLIQHFEAGVLFNGWLGSALLFDERSVALCPLPLFHVFGCHAILMGAVCAGAHVVLPSPAGFRGEGVLENFWALVERWRATFVIAVPTAMSAMLRHPVDADVSSVELLLSGSAPLPAALYEHFEQQTGIEVVEGYGMTEATALVSANPVGGEKKIGSVGIPFPYVDLEVRRQTPNGWQRCATDEIGEICVQGPGIRTDALYLGDTQICDRVCPDGFLRTGDLGRTDADGYLWITGRAKDLIIRGGHNIDPSMVESAFEQHPDVGLVAVVAQPDAHAGEVPCAYVTLAPGAPTDAAALAESVNPLITEQAARPKRIVVIDDMPLTTVGKISKLALRKRAIQEVFDEALEAAALAPRVVEVADHERFGQIVVLTRHDDDEKIGVHEVLEPYGILWR